MAQKLRGQLFARLALDYFDHPKIAALSDGAVRAHLEMLVYSRKYLTDGHIPMRIAMRYASHVIDELASNDVDRPSVIRHDDGSLSLYGYEDFQETRAEVEGRRRSAKDRAQARWAKDAASNAVSNATSNAHSNAVSNAETETETEIHIHAQPTVAREPSRFPDWWNIWGKKKAKGDAEKAYKAAVPKKITHDDLMTKTQAYWEHVRRTGMDTQYVPYPATWLRAEQWDDELDAGQAQRPLDPLKDW